MATNREFMDYVVEQIELGDRLTFKKMFGDYALYVDGKVVALVCDNRLFVKPTTAAERMAPDLPLQPPYPGAKDHVVADEWLDDADAIRALVLETAPLLPAPKPRKPRRGSRSARKPAARNG